MIHEVPLKGGLATSSFRNGQLMHVIGRRADFPALGKSTWLSRPLPHTPHIPDMHLPFPLYSPISSTTCRKSHQNPFAPMSSTNGPNPGPDPDSNQRGQDHVQPGPFKCNVCQRTYARIDHLARHFRSRKVTLENFRSRYNWVLTITAFRYLRKTISMRGLLEDFQQAVRIEQKYLEPLQFVHVSNLLVVTY